MSSPMSIYQQYIHKAHYARWMDDVGRREDLPETIARYMTFMQGHLAGELDFKLPKTTFNELTAAINGLEIMPSMRAMMTAGPALARCATVAYNCSYIAVNKITAFDEILYLLMGGSGVGFSCESKFVQKLPDVPASLVEVDRVISVEDNRTGWAEALRALLRSLYAGEIPKFDFTKVRPRGSKLKTMGGRASGPDPLRILFEYCIALFKKAVGRKLNTLEVHDFVCVIGDVIVAGSVRRSALISLSDLQDDRMRMAKSGEWYRDFPHRANANNSAVYEGLIKPDIGSFMHEWLALYNSRSGERGIFNRQAAKDKARANGRRVWDREWGCNPCFAYDTPLLTSGGYKEIGSLDGQTVELINHLGQKSTGSVWKTGTKAVVELKFRGATADPLVCTPDHRFMLVDGGEVEAGQSINKRLMPFVQMRTAPVDKDVFKAGFLLGDGSLSRSKEDGFAGCEVNICWDTDSEVASIFGLTDTTKRKHYSREYVDLKEQYELPTAVVGKRGLPRPIWCADGLMGLFSANGSVASKKNPRVLLKTTDKDQAEKVVEVLREYFEIDSRISINKSRENEFSNGVYTMKQSYDVNISRYRSIVRFASFIGFAQSYKNDALWAIIKSKAPVVQSVRGKGEADVYDFNEPLTHWGVVGSGIVAHNCGEIVIPSSGVCNLTEAVIRADDNLSDLERKVKLATILGTFQATLTHFKHVSKEWLRNAEQERLLGVSLTGIMDNPLTSGRDGMEKLNKALAYLREVAIETNKVWAGKLGINRAAAITSVKPSGCRPADALVNTTDGIYTLEELMWLHNNDAEWCDVSSIGLKVGEAGALTKTYINGKSETLKLKLNFGMEVVSTPNHQWWVKDKGWVQADQITPGDQLDVAIGNYKSTHEKALRSLNEAAFDINVGLSHNINQPATMNPDLAWLLGYLWGDGAMSPAKYRLRWIDERRENLEKTNRVLFEQFGITGEIKPASQGRHAFSLEIGNKLLWHWLIKNGIWKYQLDDNLDYIPLVVRQSSTESIIAFLAGLFDADGWYGGKQRAVLSQSGANFTNHIQHVGWSVGLCFGRSNNVGGTNFQSENGAKSIYLMKVIVHSTDEALDLFKKHSLKVTGDFDIRARHHLNHTNLRPGLVREVVSNGELFTFDVETEKHWFYAGSVKSHNTVSQLVDSASGIHPRYARHYIRTVRGDKTNPVARYMVDAGFIHEDDKRKPDHQWVFSFPQKAPETAVLRNDLTAIQHLEVWKSYYDNWCEHNPSITVNVREDEWLGVGDWVYRHLESIGGISFLPHSDHIYDQAPYQECDQETYERVKEASPDTVDWSLLSHYEKEDETTVNRELACAGGACELK